MKKLSIIVPVYNEINTVEIIIKKLVNLNLYNGAIKEVIIVDDFSSDGSSDIIKKYETQYDFIKAIYKDKNRGKGDSQRVAKNYVTGDYDYVLIATFIDMEEYELFTQKYFLNNSNIKRFSSMVVMNHVKENLSIPLN